MRRDDFGVVYETYWASVDTFLLEIHCAHLAESKPGQFAMVECPGFFLRRPLSIFDADGSRIKFLVRIAGSGTRKISSLRRGEKIRVLGPLGNSFNPRVKKPIMLVAGGIGIAPLFFLAKKLEKSGRDFLLIYGENSKDKVIRQDFLPGNTVIYTMDGSLGAKGSAVSGVLEHFAGHQIFACGPAGMLKALYESLPDSDMWISIEQRMACGVGACQGCAIESKNGYKLVCSDGPIFRATEIW